MKVAGTDTTSYTYDALGNLVTVVLPSGQRIDYLIDGRNRRVARKIDVVMERQWLYQNGVSPVAKLDGDGDLLWRFVYGPRAHVPDLTMRGDTVYRVVSDHLGSVRALVRASDGLVRAWRNYDAWGNILNSSGPGPCLGFAGGLTDSLAGLVRFGARDYDPAVGRWTSKDPLSFRAGDTGVYTYVENDPSTYVDPTGLFRAPDDPTRLPPGWKPDPTHRDPSGQRFRNPDEPDRYVGFHRGRPGERGWKGHDHWHDSERPNEHIPPGGEIRDAIRRCPPLPWWMRIPWEIPLPIIVVPPGGFPDPTDRLPGQSPLTRPPMRT